MEKWILRNRNTIIDNLDSLNNSKHILKILINREFKTFNDINNYINPTEELLNNPMDLKDFNRVMDILLDLKDNSKKIRIVGDYDVDGIISVYILYRTFRDVGFNVDYVIPDRVKEGYGINKKIVQKAKDDLVDIIITCDNGISAIESIKFARENNICVIVTDHHDIQVKTNENGETSTILPEAEAILNPKQEDCGYKFKKLCGAGVCFKLCSEIYKRFNMYEKIEDLLEFVAIATICDVVDLEGENRYIVKKGIELLNKSKNIGLNAIFDVNSLEKGKINSYEVGFIIGPCLNALGRLESAKRGLDILLSEDSDKAYELALEIKDTNDRRKEMTVDGVIRCNKIIEENFYQNNNVIVVYDESIHESIAGIIAGRIKEKYYRPTIVLTKGEGICKGSARSIEGINIFELLIENKELLETFGGHPMASGLSLKEENIDVLRDKLNNSTKINKDAYLNIIYVDIFLPIQSIDYSFIKSLELLEPFGKANIKPILGDKSIRIRSLKRIGKNKNYLSLKLISRNGVIFDFLYFGDVEEFDKLFVGRYGKDNLESLYSGRYSMKSDFLMDILYEVKLDNYNFNETIKYFLIKYRF